MQEFAHARDPSDLPPLFHDDQRLAEAAVRGLREMVGWGAGGRWGQRWEWREAAGACAKPH